MHSFSGVSKVYILDAINQWQAKGIQNIMAETFPADIAILKKRTAAFVWDNIAHRKRAARIQLFVRLKHRV